MSSSTETEEILDATLVVQQIYLSIAAVAALAYDTLITSDREVIAIWGRRLSGVTVLFLNIRYVTLISQVAFLIDDVQPGILLRCKAMLFLYYAAEIWANIASAVFSAFRIWAIWGRNGIPLIMVLSISFVSIAINLSIYSHVLVFASSPPVPSGGCASSPSFSNTTLTRLGITSRASAIAVDTVILVATWIRTWNIHQGLSGRDINTKNTNISFSGLLIRDRTIYFPALLCLNITSLILDTTPQVLLNPMGVLIDSFTAILLCHLILNLRLFNTEGALSGTTNTRQVTSVRFAAVILDNIGASVSFGEHGDSRSLDSLDHVPVSTTLNEVTQNPLAIGLEQDICRMRHEMGHNEIIEEPRDDNRDISAA